MRNGVNMRSEVKDRVAGGLNPIAHSDGIEDGAVELLRNGLNGECPHHHAFSDDRPTRARIVWVIAAGCELRLQE